MTRCSPDLAEPALPGNQQTRLRLIRDCLRANRDHMINRFEPYKRLATMADWYEEHPQSLIYASNQFLADLLVWYHLSWMAESVQRSDARIARLQEKAFNFTLHDRRELLSDHPATVAVSRAALQEAGGAGTG